MTSPNQPLGCDSVTAHISKPIPQKLWHYTSFRAFFGIVESKKIWATEYRFLNDREEFVHSKALAQELVEEEPEIIGEGFLARDAIRGAVAVAFNTGALHEERLRIFVASFTEQGDQLSQWRGYANSSTGVSIGLDLRGLRPPSEVGTAVTFAPCLYRDVEKRLILKAVFARYRDGLQGWWDSAVGQGLTEQVKSGIDKASFTKQFLASRSKELTEVIRSCHANLQFDLLRIAPLLKNESFHEEAEWRLVLPVEAIRMPMQYPIEFRPESGSLVPYIAFPLNKPNQDGPIHCTDLILGPGSHGSAEAGINMFFQKHQIRTLARRSIVPYRPT